MNIAFAIWMTGYPIVVTIRNLLMIRIRRETPGLKIPDEKAMQSAAWMELLVWVVVGYLFYETPTPQTIESEIAEL